jgi:uncharacterized delta-60 repeat protein
MKTRERLLVASLFVARFAIGVAPAYGSAPGALDTSFGRGGIALSTLQNATPTSVLFQSNGDIIVVAMFPQRADGAIGIARFLPNGAADSTFGTNGITYVAFTTSNTPVAAAVQSDDKIVVAVRFDTGQNGLTDTGIARVNANGAPDTAFGQGGKVRLGLTNATGAVSTGPTAVLVQSDGKIVVAAGAATGGFGSTAFVRYNPNGTLDSTFGQDGIELIYAYGGAPNNLAELTTGDLLTVSGNVVIAQYSPSGALRPQVTGGTRLVTSTALAGLPTLLDPNGNVLIGIEENAGYGTHASIAQLARYLSTGGVDWSFQHPTFGAVIDAAVEPDDQKIVVIGQASVPSSASPNINLLRFNPDGSVDTTFGNAGTVSTAIAGGSASASLVAIQPDGGILVVGLFTATGSGSPVVFLARYFHRAH